MYMDMLAHSNYLHHAYKNIIFQRKENYKYKDSKRNPESQDQVIKTKGISTIYR